MVSFCKNVTFSICNVRCKSGYYVKYFKSYNDKDDEIGLSDVSNVRYKKLLVNGNMSHGKRTFKMFYYPRCKKYRYWSGKHAHLLILLESVLEKCPRR